MALTYQPGATIKNLYFNPHAGITSDIYVTATVVVGKTHVHEHDLNADDLLDEVLIFSVIAWHLRWCMRYFC